MPSLSTAGFRATGSAIVAAVVIFSAAACSSSQGAAEPSPEAKKFSDPAPPEVREPPPIETPRPEPSQELTFHNKPKPLPEGATTHDWPSFLGPTHNAVSSETKLLESFPPSGPDLVWEFEKGAGYSSPAVAGDRLVYLHRVGDEERVECLHPETGERYWQFRYPTQYRDRYGYSNGPRASPVIDGDRVFTYGAEGKLHCLKLSTGQLLWKRDLAGEFGAEQDFFGTASTPLVEGGLLIVQVGAQGGPTVAAFDTETGKMVWGAGGEWSASYSSPIPADIHGRRRVFVFAGGESRPPAGGLLSIDPRAGSVDFAFPWRSRSYESVNAAPPLVIGDRVLISASYRSGAALLKILPDFSPQVVWTTKDFDLHWTAAVHKDGYLYGFAGRNEPDAALECVDLETGKLVWREVITWEETIEWSGQQRTIEESPFRGSLLAVDGRFLALGEHGHLLWLDLSPRGYKVLSRAWLFAARETWSPPVLSRGLLYVNQNLRGLIGREPPRLACYDLRAEASQPSR